MKFLFSDHTLDTDRRELRRGDALISIEPQVFDLLLYLVQNGGRVVSKSDLFASVWRGRMVSDLTIASRLNAARKAIGDTGSEQRLIRTFPRRGIRFVGEVQTAAGGRSISRCRRSAACRAPEALISGLAANRPPRHRRPSIRQFERGAGTGIFLRRHQRGPHHRAVQAALVLHHRAQLLLHVQGKISPHEAGRRGTRRRLYRRGQRAQDGRPRAHHRAAQ